MTEEEGDDSLNDKVCEGRVGTRSQWEVTLLGLALVSGSQFYSWNDGLSAGSMEYLLAVFVCGTAYFSTILCIAEMTSALPFGGGLYGIVRVTMGPYFGYLVACCEMMLSIFHAASLLFNVGQDIIAWLGISHHYVLLFWVLLLMWTLMVNIFEVKYFWRSNIIMMIIVIVLYCIYYAVTIPCVDCERYGGGMLDGDLNARRYFKYFGYPIIMFDMLPLLPMACGDASEPRKTLPRSFLWSFGIAATNALLLTIIVGCNAPGISYFALPEVNALSYGYAKGLHIAQRAARLLGIPACLATTSALTYVYSIQMRSMAESGLSLSVLRYSHGPDHIPYMALLVGAGLAFGLLCMSHFIVDEKVLWALTGLGHTAGIFIEMVLLVSFLRFRKHLSSLPRMFTQPVGTNLAYYSLAIYVSYEQKVMFQAYVINANVTRRRRKRQALPPSTESNTPIPSVLPSANHVQQGYLERLSGTAAYVSRVLRIRSNVTFTSNLPTGTAIVKKREQKKDENSYRGYIPEDNTKSERYAPQLEEEPNITAAVHATYDKDSLFSMSSELIDCQVRNHPMHDYQSKRHQRGLSTYQIAPDNAMQPDYGLCIEVLRNLGTDSSTFLLLTIGGSGRISSRRADDGDKISFWKLVGKGQSAGSLCDISTLLLG
eukprot:scaffold5744_cov179-Ochromonas_danica.AAC.1